jgi:hypothetical protein
MVYDININDSPLKFIKENKLIRRENDTLKEGECKIDKKGLLKKGAVICKKDGKIKIMKY